MSWTTPWSNNAASSSVDAVDAGAVASLDEAVELVEPAVSPLRVTLVDPSLVVSARSEVALHAAVSAMAATTVMNGARWNIGTSSGVVGPIQQAIRADYLAV